MESRARVKLTSYGVADRRHFEWTKTYKVWHLGLPAAHPNASNHSLYLLVLIKFNFEKIDKTVVDRKRIELLPETCKAPVLPLSLTAHNLVP